MRELIDYIKEADVFKPASKQELEKRRKDRVPTAEGLIRCIYDQIGSDNQDDSEKFYQFYQGSSEQHKAVIDNVLLYLCGWTMETLYKKAQGPEYQDED